jgi:hypothetical protein
VIDEITEEFAQALDRMTQAQAQVSLEEDNLKRAKTIAAEATLAFNKIVFAEAEAQKLGLSRASAHRQA